MLFPTLAFGTFFLSVYLLSWGTFRHPATRKLVLVTASFFFYGYWDWRFCFLLFTSALINFIVGLYLTKTRGGTRATVLFVGVSANLVILGFFKYYGFFVESLGDLLYATGFERDLDILEIVLPVGISFFTFQGISYIVDIARRELDVSKSFLDVLLYISFFPQLVAGPIVRASDFFPQLRNSDGQEPNPNCVLAGFGVLMISMGLFKKVVLANYLATEIVDDVFFDPSIFSAVDVLLAAYGYSIQIYCDFSAYSDIALGVAALLGYKFKPNFNQPYRSRSFSEFWRRWHISLSSWLRDYLYIPLGGNRRGRVKKNRNLMTTMLLGGLWHGASWKFVLWGALHGGALIIEDLLGWNRRAKSAGLMATVVSTLIVFHFVCLTFVIFRIEDLSLFSDFCLAFGNLAVPLEKATPFVVALIFLGFVIQFVPPRLFQRVETRFSRFPVLIQALLFALMVVTVDALGPEGVAPFIYFQF